MDYNTVMLEHDQLAHGLHPNKLGIYLRHEYLRLYVARATLRYLKWTIGWSVDIYLGPPDPVWQKRDKNVGKSRSYFGSRTRFFESSAPALLLDRKPRGEPWVPLDRQDREERRLDRGHHVVGRVACHLLASPQIERGDSMQKGR